MHADLTPDCERGRERERERENSVTDVYFVRRGNNSCSSRSGGSSRRRLTRSENRINAMATLIHLLLPPLLMRIMMMTRGRGVRVNASPFLSRLQLHVAAALLHCVTHQERERERETQCALFEERDTDGCGICI